MMENVSVALEVPLSVVTKPKCNKLKTKSPYLYKNKIKKNMGRNGYGPKWYGPKWLWAEMVMGRNGYGPK